MTGEPSGILSELLPLEAVAERLGVSRRTIGKWTADRGLPVVRVTRKTVRVDVRRLDEWLAERCVSPTGSDEVVDR